MSCQGMEGCYVVMSRYAGVFCCFVKVCRGVMLKKMVVLLTNFYESVVY